MRIISGYVVPLMRDDRQIWADTVDPESFEVVPRFLSKVFESSSKLLSQLDGTSERLNMLADLIVASLRAPITLTPLPGSLREVIRKKTLLDPDEQFWIWEILREYAETHREVDEVLKVPIDSLAEIAGQSFERMPLKILANMVPGLADLYDLLLIDSREDESLRSALLKMPADTRPGLNTSKLIPHLLSTSALASILYLSSRAASDERAKMELSILRISSLLHDIGKPRAWGASVREGTGVPHAPQSAFITREIFSQVQEFISEDAIDAICSIIREHHRRKSLGTRNVAGIPVNLDKLKNLLTSADRLSSSVDRLVAGVSETVAETLGEDLETIKDMLEKSGDEAWKFWSSKPNDLLLRATEEAAKYLLWKAPLDRWSIETGLSDQSKVSVLMSDIRGIQGYIRREYLKTMIGASYFINFLTLYAIPRSLLELLRIPPECIIYAGGGIVLAFAPIIRSEEKLESEMVKIIRRLCGKITPPHITFASTPLTTDWILTSRRIGAKLAARKTIAPLEDLEHRSLGIEVPCERCGRKSAVRAIEGEYICDECYYLGKVGDALHFGAKVRACHEEKLVKLEWDALREHVLEWLSGRELKAGSVAEAANVAFIKADGNMMGAFLAGAVSPSDAILRSLRVDYALKKGISEVYSKLSGEDLARAYVGTLYAGGDDMLAIWPAKLAIQAALMLSYWFWRELGGVRQLSIGIAAGKPKYNVWAMLDTAGELLDRSKKAFRDVADPSKLDEFNSEIFALLAFLYSDTHVPLPSWVSEVLRPDQPYSWQPLAFYKKFKYDKLADGWALVSFLTDIGNGSLKERVEKVFQGLSDAVEAARRLREVTRDVYETTAILANKGEEAIIMSCYSAYKASRDVLAQYLYKKICNMCLTSGLSRPAPILDLFLLSKFIMGE